MTIPKTSKPTQSSFNPVVFFNTLPECVFFHHFITYIYIYIYSNSKVCHHCTFNLIFNSIYILQSQFASQMASGFQDGKLGMSAMVSGAPVVIFPHSEMISMNI